MDKAFDISFKASARSEVWEELTYVAEFHETTPQAVLRFLIHQERMAVKKYEQQQRSDYVLGKRRVSGGNTPGNGRP